MSVTSDRNLPRIPVSGKIYDTIMVEAWNSGHSLEKISKIIDVDEITPDVMCNAIERAIHRTGGKASDFACMIKGHIPMTTMKLLNRGIDIGDYEKFVRVIKLSSEFGSFGTRTLIRNAAQGGNIENVKKILKYHGESYSGYKITNRGSIYHLLMDFNLDVKVWKERKLDLEIMNLHNETALVTAIMKGELQYVIDLVDMGAEIDYENSRRWHPVMCALGDGRVFGRPCREILKFLISRGVELNVPLSGEYRSYLDFAIREGSFVNILVEGGADPNFKIGGNTLAHYYTSSQCFESLNRLLRIKDVDINARNHKGVTPLMMAAILGNTKLVSMILKAGGDPTLVSHAGKNAASYAFSLGHSDVMKLLSETTIGTPNNGTPTDGTPIV